jgi:hypothetical protein
MTIQARLETCMRKGNLRVSDLACWFGRPHPTVRGWVKRGIQPGGGPMDQEQVEVLLGVLESMIGKNKRFPVPLMGPRQRKAYVARVRATVREGQLA